MKQYALYFMGLAYILAGVNHFWHPGFYLKLIQNFLPYPMMIIYVSGIAEILCGAGIMIPAYQKFSAWALIFLLVAIFPANINMAIHYQDFHVSKALAYGRLPIQFLLIWWAYIYTYN
jgi:uncharacterized membrane protein